MAFVEASSKQRSPRRSTSSSRKIVFEMENVDLTVLKPEDATLLRAVPGDVAHGVAARGGLVRDHVYHHLLVLGWRVRHRGDPHAGWQRQLGPMGEAGRGSTAEGARRVNEATVS